VLCGGHFECDKKEQRIIEIEQLEVMDGFWLDSEHAGKIQKEKSMIQEDLTLFKELQEKTDDFDLILDYWDKDGNIAEQTEQLNEAFEGFLKLYTEAEKKVLLSGECDFNNAIISINAGAGGTESCDWAMMIHRMMSRWCEKRGFKVQILDIQAGETAGMKSSTFTVTGPYAYGLMHSETGIHRLVRISPFDSNARRHTSFASVYVSPEVDDTIDIKIEDKDLRIDVYRSGGAGGQSVNTTDSAVRITHLPTNTVVTCQNERSQLQNKMQAMKVLKSRLYEQEMEKRRQEAEKLENEKKDIAWGSQIRSYVLHPYKMVKDHRTKLSVSSAEGVLDGELDEFMTAYLQWKASGGRILDDEEHDDL
jgi:peptide chain release factor 2